MYPEHAAPTPPVDSWSRRRGRTANAGKSAPYWDEAVAHAVHGAYADRIPIRYSRYVSATRNDPYTYRRSWLSVAPIQDQSLSSRRRAVQVPPPPCVMYHMALGDARLSSHSRVNWGNVIACGQRHGSAAVWCIHPRARWDTPAMIGTYRPRVSVTRSSSRSTVVTPLTVSTRRRWLRLLVAAGIGNCVAVR